MDTLLKSGQFAKLCRTTKETLRHYERVGILRPALQEENGYKKYSLAQIADFSLIAALQSAGLSLGEIKDFLQESGCEHLHAVLHQRINVIERQKRDLEREQRMLEGALGQTEKLQAWFKDGAVRISPSGHRWRIVECPEEYFIETATPYVEDREEEFLRAISEHLEYCEKQGCPVMFQEAYRVDEASTAKGLYAQGFCAEAQIAAPVESSRLRVKPEGTYLQWLNGIDLQKYLDDEPVDTNPMFEAYDAMRAFAKDQGWTLSGDLYDVVLSLYGGNLSDTFYTEVSMRVSC